MKFCGKYETPQEIKESSEKLAKELAGDKWAKYRGNKVLVPSEQYEHVKSMQPKKLKNSMKAAEFRQNGNFEKAELLEQMHGSLNRLQKMFKIAGLVVKKQCFQRTCQVSYSKVCG